MRSISKISYVRLVIVPVGMTVATIVAFVTRSLRPEPYRRLVPFWHLFVTAVFGVILTVLNFYYGWF